MPAEKDPVPGLACAPFAAVMHRLPHRPAALTMHHVDAPLATPFVHACTPTCPQAQFIGLAKASALTRAPRRPAAT